MRVRVLRRAALTAVKIVGIIGAAVALFVPVNTIEKVLIFFVSVMVVGASIIAATALNDDPQEVNLLPPK